MVSPVSGGPMLVKRNKGVYLIGTIRATTGCSIAWFNNVIFYADWIRKYMKEEEEKRCKTDIWSRNSNSIKPWLARMDRNCIRGKFKYLTIVI